MLRAEVNYLNLYVPMQQAVSPAPAEAPIRIFPSSYSVLLAVDGAPGRQFVPIIKPARAT